MAMNLRSWYGRAAVVLALAAAVPLGGCKTMTAEEEANLTPAEAQMRQEADSFNETVLGGAATGALIGGLLGALAGAASGDKRRIGTYAAIGAAGGGILGGVDGYITAKAQEASNNRVRMTQSMTADVEKDNQRLSALVDNSRRVLAESQARIAEANGKLDAGMISLQQALAEKARVERNRDVLAEALDNLKQRRDNYQSAGARTGAATNTAYAAQIGTLNAQIAQLEANIGEMNKVLAVSKV